MFIFWQLSEVAVITLVVWKVKLELRELSACSGATRTRFSSKHRPCLWDSRTFCAFHCTKLSASPGHHLLKHDGNKYTVALKWFELHRLLNWNTHTLIYKGAYKYVTNIGWATFILWIKDIINKTKITATTVLYEQR